MFSAFAVVMTPSVQAKGASALVCKDWGMPYPDNLVYLGEPAWNGYVCLSWGYDY